MAIEVTYEVDLLEEEIQPRLFILGQLISQEMRKLAIRMDLKDSGNYSQGFLASVKNGVLIIENRVAYAEYLEYGTYEYFQKFGLKKFPTTADPKKKDIPIKSRVNLPKGMQPFAVMRRVLYNKTLMRKLIKQVFT